MTVAHQKNFWRKFVDFAVRVRGAESELRVTSELNKTILQIIIRKWRLQATWTNVNEKRMQTLNAWPFFFQ